MENNPTPSTPETLTKREQFLAHSLSGLIANMGAANIGLIDLNRMIEKVDMLLDILDKQKEEETPAEPTTPPENQM